MQDYEAAQIRDILDPGFLRGWLNRLAEYWMFCSHVVNQSVVSSSEEHCAAISCQRKGSDIFNDKIIPGTTVGTSCGSPLGFLPSPLRCHRGYAF